MKIAQIHHHAESGWSQALPVALDGPQTLVLAFCARTLNEAPHVLRDLGTAFPSSVVLGCSSAGEISASQVGDGSISVLVAQFARTQLRHASAALMDSDGSHAAGASLAAQLSGDGLRAVFVLSSGLGVNGTALVRGLASGLPDGVSISGGLAGDGSDFRQTWVLDGGEAREHCVTAVGFYGDALRLGHGCCGGWLDFGPERAVTRSEGNVLYELDGKPALSLYKHYLGDLAAQLPGSALLFPLSLRAAQGDARSVVRTILAIDEATQSMTFAGDIPMGSTAQLMRTSVDRLVASAEEAAGQAMTQLSTGSSATPQAVLAVSVSCIGRRLVMGARTEEEVEAVVDRLPAGSAHAGFYSYGEIAPADGFMSSDLHNQTMTLTVFSEA